MVTPVIHPKTEPLRELAMQLAKAPPFAKLAFAGELIDRLITVVADECHARDRLEAALAELVAAELSAIAKLEARIETIAGLADPRHRG